MNGTIDLSDCIEQKRIATLVYKVACVSCGERVVVRVELGENAPGPIRCPECSDGSRRWTSR